MDKKVHFRIDRDSPDITLKELLKKMEEIQSENPELEVFFDGDEYAICSRPKRKEEE